MNRILRVAMLALGVALLLPTAQAEAGLFKNLLTKVDTLMRNYNENMWMGENSLGNTVLKGVKGEGGNFFQVFDATAAALKNAQDQALTDLKGVWEAIKDIVLWLPRKLKEFAEKTIGKLNAMNQGGTVKERFDNLVGGGGGGGGGMAQLQALSGGGFGGGGGGGGAEGGALDAGDLESLLSDTPGARGSMSADEALELYGEGGRASADAPAAPGGALEDAAQGFGQLMDVSAAISDKAKQGTARKRVRLYYALSVDKAMLDGDLPRTAALVKAGKKLFEGNPDGMTRVMAKVARRHPKHQKALTKAYGRIANLARR